MQFKNPLNDQRLRNHCIGRQPEWYFVTKKKHPLKAEITGLPTFPPQTEFWKVLQIFKIILVSSAVLGNTHIFLALLERDMIVKM